MDSCNDSEIEYDMENELLIFGKKSIKCKTGNFDYYSTSGKLNRFTNNNHQNIINIFSETKNEYDKYPIYKTRKVILLLLLSLRIFPKDVLLIILKKLWHNIFFFYYFKVMY
jgi:hypothetical protein